jgi:patatin-like phospholipase/acyl hydrolase
VSVRPGQRPFRVLSLDGGGIRGLIPALFLTELERRAGKPICDLFDLVAGTSTGGILALGLTCPDPASVADDPDGRPSPLYSARRLADLYARDGERIFRRSVWHRIRSVGVLAEEKYQSEGVDELLRAYFGDARLTHALAAVLVTAYDLELRKPHFFKSHKAESDDRRDFLIRDAARATVAAPTYFEPARIRVRPGEDWVTLVDGGVYANNPAACALVEAMSFWKRPASEVLLLSLGTGEYTKPILFEEARGWGLARWAQPILDVVFDGVNDTVDYQAGSLLAPFDGRVGYTRVQPRIAQHMEQMDDVDPLNLRALRIVAKQVIHQYDRDLDRWAEALD